MKMWFYLKNLYLQERMWFTLENKRVRERWAGEREDPYANEDHLPLYWWNLPLFGKQNLLQDWGITAENLENWRFSLNAKLHFVFQKAVRTKTFRAYFTSGYILSNIFIFSKPLKYRYNFFLNTPITL